MSDAPKILFMPHANLQYCQLQPSRRGWVIDHSYSKLFELVARNGYRIAFEASGFTVDMIAELRPKAMDQLKGLIADGQIEPVSSPQIHLMLANIDPAIGLASLKQGLDTWEKHVGVRPTVGWNPECGWADYVPELYREAGFESLVMDGDSFYLSFPEIREATKLRFDVKGHSNKDKLFRIEQYIRDKPQFLKYLTNPSQAPNGLKLLFRSDMMANPMLWYLMGACEGVREKPICISEIEAMLAAWKDRIAQTGTFIMPFAEDAEYIGTSAYFFVKQFGLARFFEPATQSVESFHELIKRSLALGYQMATAREIFAGSREILPNPYIANVENGIAWHGGTAKAWANTKYARVLDPVCRMVFLGIESVARHLNQSIGQVEGDLQQALAKLASAYVSDARWPPEPTSPGRFNVEESVADLFAANRLIASAMEKRGIQDRRSLYSPSLMETQIAATRDELAAMTYFEESSSMTEVQSDAERDVSEPALELQASNAL